MAVTADVAIISCLYGDTHDKFLQRWSEAISQLDPAPQEVIIGMDWARSVPIAATVTAEIGFGWRYPQPFYLQQALNHVASEWVWIHDIDDLALPNALEGVQESKADVVQFGYVRSDGETYLPPRLTGQEVAEADHNPFVAGSAIRTEVLRLIGGFPDVALQDWALWRRLGRAGATFASFGPPRFRYMRHPKTRGATELTSGERRRHIAEMIDYEESLALTV